MSRHLDPFYVGPGQKEQVFQSTWAPEDDLAKWLWEQQSVGADLDLMVALPRWHELPDHAQPRCPTHHSKSFWRKIAGDALRFPGRAVG